MKIARLLLHAFGPFTDTELDFAGNGAHPAANLHLIYGPNEAGKSSALRAMLDLRFGIPLRSPDDFKHPSNQLRIAGVFVDDQDAEIGLTRRKGRGDTLSRFDTATGQPANPPEAGRKLENALTGGLERKDFEAMFGLNHIRLREGGDLLLKGEGELGATLFEASAGTRGIPDILASLEADAKALYNPHGRAQSASINEAKRELDHQRQQWKQALTRPGDWQALNRAHERARDALAEIDDALETLRRRENELTELRTVAPLLSALDRTRTELESLAEVPDLPESAREDRLAAEQALQRAEEDMRKAEQELAPCAEALSSLVIERPLLEHADTIERLAATLETVSRSRVEAGQQEVSIEQIEHSLAALAARVAPEQELQAIVSAPPSAADRVALDAHLEAISLLGERLKGHRSQEITLTEAIDSGTAGTQSLPNPEARQKLAAALKQAQNLGDIPGYIVEVDRSIRRHESELKQALSDLGLASTDELQAARPLLDSQISTARQALADIIQEEIRLKDEAKDLADDVAQQRLRERQLAAQGEVVTAETLQNARGHRDKGWDLIRQAYVERTHDADALSQEFDPERALPEVFEAAQGESDRQADLLRADTERAARYAECQGRIDAMEQRRDAIVGELEQLRVRQTAAQTSWRQLLTDARLPMLDAETLREWQVGRKGALALVTRMGELADDKERMQGDLTKAVDALTSALEAVGEPAKDGTLAFLIDQAQVWETATTEAAARQSERARAVEQRRAELQKVRAESDAAETDLRTHEEALRAWHARLFLPAGSSPESVKARLVELDEVTRQHIALGEATAQRSRLLAVVEDFSTQASKLAPLLGEPVPELADDFVGRLKRRLGDSREQEQQRAALTRDQDRAQNTKRQADLEKADQTDILTGLCAAAGVEAVEQLPAVEESANRKRLARAALLAQQQQLAEASTHPEDDLRDHLEGQDTIAIDAEREKCRGEIKRREHEQTSSRQTEEQTRRALEAIDSSDAAAKAREAMESAAARYRSAIRPWARLKLAHALLRNALERFRDRAQAPMVAAASTYFSLMTGGRYLRLVADELDGEPVLRAERDDGVLIGVEAMSEGTADQLYLALRLAALELRRASHPQMPLVLDDVLITSDDARAANILRALEKFAEGGQVMLFTHHRHLLDVAHSALSSQNYGIHSL